MFLNNNIIDNFRKLINDYKVPGIAILIRRGDGTCLFDTSGYADITKQNKFDLDTCFPIASITKLFAAIVILRLHDKNNICIYHKLSNYGIQNSIMNNITIEDLLMHTSDKSYTDFKYSDRRFYFLESVIMNATGKTFYQLLQEIIIQPLQLASTFPGTMINNTIIYQRLAKTYKFAHGEFEEIKLDTNTFFGVNSGLVSSIKDISILLENIISGTLLSEPLKEIMFSNKHSHTKVIYQTGHGVFVCNINNRRLVWNFGCNYGSSIITIMLPDNKSYAILAANSNVMCCDFSLEKGKFDNSPFCNRLLDILIDTQ